MPSFVLRDVSFSHSIVPVLERVDLELAPGWHGIVGANGAGKTTLLRLLAGELTPESGRVERPTSIALCPQRVDVPGADVAALAEGEDGRAHELRARLALHGPSLARWSTLSPGERKRWQIGGALYGEPEALLLDEPTGHLDAGARQLLVSALERFSGIGVLVSHDRALLEALGQSTHVVQNARIWSWALPLGAALAERERELASGRNARERARSEVLAAKRALDSARRAHAGAERSRSAGARMKGPRDSDARGALAQGRADRAAASTGRAVSALRADLARAEAHVPAYEGDREVGRSVFLRWEPPPAERLLFLGADVPRGDGAPLLGGLSLVVRRTDRIHVRGDNGAGKSTLLRALEQAWRGPPDKLFVLPQDLSRERGEALVRSVRALPPEPRGRVLSLAAALGADASRLLATPSPSPGEARKLALAMGMGTHAWLLLLDEPENHLDLPAVGRLEAALAAWPGAMVLVTHDPALPQRLATSTWTVGGGAVSFR
jgi:ATPase subunit of ABC transporter with duplicated ATPase domains